MSQIANSKSADGVPQSHFRFDFVSLGYSYIAHVVAEARDLEVLCILPCSRSAQPCPEFGLDVFVLPKSNYYFPIKSHSAADEAEFAIAVGRLIQIHEIHVYRRPGQLLIELCVQMDQGLMQYPQSVNPHLGRRESMHPSDETHARLSAVCFKTKLINGFRRSKHGLKDNLHGDSGRFVQLVCDLARMYRYLIQRLLPVKMLAPCHQTSFKLGEIDH